MPNYSRRWEVVRADFIHGEFKDGRHRYPTAEDLAKKHDIPVATIRRWSKTDGHKGLGTWMQQRQKAEAQAKARTDAVQADRIAESRATFDNHTLFAAHAGLQKLAGALAAWDAFEPGVENGRRRLRSRAPHEIQSLAAALISFQRVGRLALGYATDNVAYRGETRVELGEAAAAVLAAIDPKELSFEQLEAVQEIFARVSGVDEAGGGEVH